MMADVNNNAQQRLADRNSIKQWFKRGLKPLESHFWAWIDSFWHKNDLIPMSSIQNLTTILDNKSNVGHTHIEYVTLPVVEDLVRSKMNELYRIKPSVANLAALNALLVEENVPGDVRNVLDTNMNYVWDGDFWDPLGGNITLSDYVLTTTFNAAIADMATQTWVSQQLANVSVDLSGYYTAEEVDWQIGQAVLDMATKTWVTEQLTDLVTNGTINLDGYATELWVTQQGYLTSSSLNDYATQNWVTNQLANVTVDLTGYATEQWVGQQGYLTSSALNDYATISQLNNKIDKVTPSKLSYALITPTGTIQTSIPVLGIPIKILGIDNTNLPCTMETEFFSAVSSEVTEPTILELEAFNTQEVHYPNQDMFCKKIGSRWFKFNGIEIL